MNQNAAKSPQLQGLTDDDSFFNEEPLSKKADCKTTRKISMQQQEPHQGEHKKQSSQTTLASVFQELTSTYEGRDKITKGIQYLCKLVAWHHHVADPEHSIRYISISEKFRDARSVFRLTKFMSEIKRFQIICQMSDDKFSIIMNIISRAFYLVHWLFDNIFILLKLSNTELPSWLQKYGFDRDSIRSLSRQSWLIGIAFYLIFCVKILRKTYTDESDLKVAAVGKMTVKEVKRNLEIICRLRRDYQFNFIRVFSDLMLCLNENNIPFRVLGKRINNGVEGFFGILSASIYLYGMFSSKH